MGGDPPLGPGAPPAERLAAFYRAMVDLLERHVHLALGTEVGASRFATGAYGFWRAHVQSLLRAAGAPATLTDTLLAPLAPDVYDYQRRQRGLKPKQIADALAVLAERVLAGKR